ncbi:MAG: SDR family oxidoreductase [Candidatus Kapaibacterium sp.]|nr:MAG: SDR family oxidoreductase [Candidatus Kapabacteria bacterium]
MTTFSEKIILVTGAASGIGAATATAFAREGALVLCADINLEASSRLASELLLEGVKAHAIELDVASEDAWNLASEYIRTQHGRLDVLVNNAGISFGKPLLEMTLAEWQRVMQINCDGVMLGTQAAFRLMFPQNSGVIINVASASGIKPVAGASAYCTSKAGAIMLTKAAALEAAPHKVRVNAIAPSGVTTPMWESMEFFQGIIAEAGSKEAAYKALAVSVPLARYATPEEIAEAALYLASPKAGFITGAVLSVDGAYTL